LDLRRVGFSMTETFDLAVTVAYARWKRAVDLLVREVVRRHAHNIAADETAQAERRVRSLRRIVRKALSEYSRLQIARQ
jgi:hypothetical protein